MEMNFLAIAVAALIPLIVGAIWYNPKVFGTKWLKASGLKEEDIQTGNMLLIFVLTYVLSLLLALTLSMLVIHQNHIYSAVMNEAGFGDSGSDLMNYLQAFMDKYGDNFRTFKHGAFHGGVSGFTFAGAVIGIITLFERRGFSYFAVHTGYWIVSMLLMGGLISAWQ